MTKERICAILPIATLSNHTRAEERNKMAKRTDFQKRVAAAYNQDTGNLFADKVICKGDGSVDVRHGYFYKFGNTADKWGAAVVKDLASVSSTAKVQSVLDVYKHWPADSYFSAIVVLA